MDDESIFGPPTGDTKRFFVSGPPGDTQIDPAWNVERLLFGGVRRLLLSMARRSLMIGLSTLCAGRLTLRGLTVEAEVVMVRFSDEPVTGFVREKKYNSLTPFT